MTDGRVRRSGSDPAGDGAEDTFELTTVGIRALSRNVSGVMADVARSGRPAVVTKHGEPVAVVVPLRSGELDRATLQRVSEQVAGPCGPAGGHTPAGS